MRSTSDAIEKATVVVTLNVQIQINITDDGYLGTGVSIEEHIKQAKSQSEMWGFLVQRGATEPEIVKAQNIQLKSVVIIPKETQ